MFMSRFIRTDYHAGQIFIPHRRTSLSSLSLSDAVVKPHQDGDAYSMEAKVVMRATGHLLHLAVRDN